MTALDQLADRIALILDPDALDPVEQERARAVADAVLTTVAAQLKAADDLAEAASCIRHWHDAMRDGSGMVVSAEHVRKLWEANAAYSATKATPD